MTPSGLPPSAPPANSGAAGVITAAQMQLVLNVSRKLSVTADLDSLLDFINDSVVDLLECERSSIWLHDAARDELWTKSASGMAAAGGQIRIPATTGLAGATFRGAALIHVEDAYADARFNPDTDRRTGFRTRSILAMPMLDLDRKPVGVVQAINKAGGGGFTDADEQMIQLVADQAGVAIQRYHLQQQAIEGIALRKELDLARKVQEQMIPKTTPDVPGLEAAGWTRPASMNGGDCFDLWKLPDGRLGIFLADASGHGIAPALVVMQARTLVRTLSETDPDPGSLLMRVNARLADDMVPGRFVTAFLGFLAPDTGRLDWFSAGHSPVLVRPRCDDPIADLLPTAPPLGILPDLSPDPASPIQLAPGGWLAVISDGLSEAFDPAGELFGIERLIETLQQTDCHPETTLALLRAAMLKWQGKEEPIDDQTAVVVRRSVRHPS
jgi:phosphoserine phosphatase RsbU/P